MDGERLETLFDDRGIIFCLPVVMPHPTSTWPMHILQVYEKLTQYIDCPEERWKYLLRAKRGQADTSKPGNSSHCR